ncbi:hypothetical protein [Streptosporangium pseudovulgare]|uniref:Uncharacterized protein n=1 Tax=Streptosporangium pseudovulgare TaxID=35765 RepID=A0ABQ2R0R6_9ACTN|nr:hypothetical protein [Streptosporangium pseudovulgare]GGQ07774.1 hypothetical protein GCM10010140_42650 [Streptosporangium pseudovulgare]
MKRPGGAARRPAGDPPFEEDCTPALILGEAFPPAGDAAITDPIITWRLLSTMAG